jgi:hypothetical protein
MLTTKRGGRFYVCTSPHAGQIFCDLGIFAPHSTQHLAMGLSCVMLTGLFTIDITSLKGRPEYLNTIFNKVENYLIIRIFTRHDDIYGGMQTRKNDDGPEDAFKSAVFWPAANGRRAA